MHRIRNGQYEYRNLNLYRDNLPFGKFLNHEPFIRRFLVSQHIAFYRTPGLLRFLIAYSIRSCGRVLTTFVPTLLKIFCLLRLLFGRLYRASYRSALRPIGMSESQGVEYQHLLRKWDFTTQIKSVVKQILFCSANLFPFLECFVSEQFARPSSKGKVPLPRS